MNGSEKTMNLSKILVKNYTLQSDFESTGSLICQGDITGVLSASHQHVELLPFLRVMKRAHCNCTTWFATEAVLSDFFKGLRVKQF